MVITKEMLQFFKTAKTVCSKGGANRLEGIIINDKEMIVVNDQFQVRYTCEASLFSDGATVALPLKAAEYIASFGKGAKFSWEVEGKNCVIKCGRSHSKFPTLNIDKVPKLATASDKTIKCNPEALELLKVACSAAEISSTRPITQGVCFNDDKKGNIVAFATDGFKLAYVPFAESSMDFDVKIRKDMLLLAIGTGLLDGEFRVTISEDNRKVLFSNENTTIVCPQIDYTEMNVNDCFAMVDKAGKEFIFDRNEIIQTFKRASLIANTNTTIMGVDGKESSVCIKLKDSTADFSETVPVENCSDGEEPLNIGINTNMMLVALSSFKDDKLKLRHGGALSAYYITNEKIKYLLMPVRLA